MPAEPAKPALPDIQRSDKVSGNDAEKPEEPFSFKVSRTCALESV